MIKLWFVTGLFISLTSLFAQLYYYDVLDRIDEGLNTLQRLPIIDEEIYFTMMMVHTGIEKNFDNLVKLNNIHNTTTRSLSLQLKTFGNSYFNEELKKITSIRQLKESQLETFKSDMALLNNAKIYVSQKMQRLSESENQLPAILALTSALVSFSETPTTQAAQGIRQRVATLNYDTMPESTQQSLNKGLVHLEYYLDHKVSALTATPLTSNWIQIPSYISLRAALLAKHHDTVFLQKTAYISLTCGILLLISLAGFMVKRYMTAKRALITLNKSLENRIREATKDIIASRDEAMQADAAKTNFLANMSHELRTPLNAIIGFSTRLERRLANDVNESSLAALKNIRTNGTYLLNFFNDLVELSTANEYEPGAMISQIDVTELCKRAIDEMGAYFHRKDTILVLEQEESIFLSSYESCIQRVIFGIINTAMHNTAAGEIRLQIKELNDGCLITTTDTGEPLTEKRIAFLLSPLDASKNSAINVQGIGLGLSVVSRMLEILNGNLELSTSENENTYKAFIPSIDEEDSGEFLGAP